MALNQSEIDVWPVFVIWKWLLLSSVSASMRAFRNWQLTCSFVRSFARFLTCLICMFLSALFDGIARIWLPWRVNFPISFCREKSSIQSILLLEIFSSLTLLMPEKHSSEYLCEYLKTDQPRKKRYLLFFYFYVSFPYFRVGLRLIPKILSAFLDDLFWALSPHVLSQGSLYLPTTKTKGVILFFTTTKTIGVTWPKLITFLSSSSFFLVEEKNEKWKVLRERARQFIALL